MRITYARLLLFGALCLLNMAPASGQSVTPVFRWSVESPGTRLRSKDVVAVDGPGGKTAGRFNGRSSVVEPDRNADWPQLKDEFTISLWARTQVKGHETSGDLLSLYDPESKAGFRIGIDTHAGVTNSQSNLRQLHFGLQTPNDASSFIDHGRLGSAVYVFSLCVHNGRLYAATCEAGPVERGHVYRFEDSQWKDLGSPDVANAISAMAVFDNQLYVASSKYRLAGSSLPESTNANFGGRIFRLGKNDTWEPCGRLSEDTEAVASLIDFRGKLYASSLYKPAGFFCYDGVNKWVSLPTPDGKRVEAMTVFNDRLYATSYDEGSVFRFDGERWELVTRIPNATQTYGFGIHQGKLFVSEWPQAHVYRMDQPDSGEWTDTGKLGEELEAMPLLTYNGSLYCGSLPTAEVYRMEHQGGWKRIGQVDHTPEVKYRRAWSMAVHNGRLFVGTLPSGHVQSMSAGENLTWDQRFPDGWHHVAAVRAKDRLQLFVDGQNVAESRVSSEATFPLRLSELQIGFGAQDYFDGDIHNVQIFDQALNTELIKSLATPE